MRVGYLACIASLVACAQGIESPGTENLSNATDLGGASSALGGGGSGNTGNVASAGSPATQAGAPGSSAGSSSAGSPSAGSSSGGTSSGGSSSSAGSSGAATAGAGPTTGMCGHPQPGNMGPTVQFKSMAPDMSVPYIYFYIEIDNPDDNPLTLSDLHLRYYFDNDLTNPMTDFYSPQTKDAKGITHNLGSNDLKATYMPTYVEVGFTSAVQLNIGENVTFQVHMHSDPSGQHSQSGDYSYSPSTSLIPWCNVALFQQSALAWGTPPP